MAVLDASVLVEYLAGGEHAAEARRRILQDPDRLWAPHLIDAEIGHVLRRGTLAGELSDGAARAALDALADVPLRRAPHRALLDRAWSLRANVSFYDGLYIALAERLEMPLLTLDGRLARAPGLRVGIEVIA
ncbi:MAG TPA: type II toxin-antitoxin system VapC family toxin [Solirubrobacteraceae bacterium]